MGGGGEKRAVAPGRLGVQGVLLEMREAGECFLLMGRADNVGDQQGRRHESAGH